MHAHVGDEGLGQPEWKHCSPARVLGVFAAVGHQIATLQPLPLTMRDSILHEVRGDLCRCLLDRVVGAFAHESLLLILRAARPLLYTAVGAAQRCGHVLDLADALWGLGKGTVLVSKEMIKGLGK